MEGGVKKTATRQGRKGTNKQRCATIQSKAKSYSQAHKDWMSERGPDGLSEGGIGGGG